MCSSSTSYYIRFCVARVLVSKTIFDRSVCGKNSLIHSLAGPQLALQSAPMFRSSYLWNSQAKVCPVPLSGSLRRPLPAAPLLSLLVSQCHLPIQDSGRSLVFDSSATTQRPLQQSHSPFWASGCLRAELSLNRPGLLGSHACPLLLHLCAVSS